MPKASSSSNSARCPICTEPFPLDQILVLHCGHGFCFKCTTTVEKKCWVCRTPLAGLAPHRIYLDAEKHDAVIEGLNKIDLDAPAGSVAKAGGKIQRLLNKPDPELLQAVLDAKRDMEERITPMFEKFEQMRDENERLLTKYNEAKTKVEREKRKLGDAKKAVDAAQEDLSRQTERMRDYKACIKSKEEEIAELKAALELKDKQINLANKKLKVLAKQDKKRRRQSQDGDISLQVITPPSDSEDPAAHPVKRRKQSVS
ncbi:hypothetical protein D9619_012195 [Psilocybe cf. subviscida]|uniref:RING-type domain-containing protein n=1 Tax=Psilocybe cf. subviscida TaxID=2480587 RepID=A0A8H5B9J8_9AGAR|nr:hypothetical protein D9619_012195 [Psilocybe cf. subviscida]